MKARAFYPGMTDSLIAAGSYSIYVATPILTPPAGIYQRSVTVSATSPTPGATLRYTLDGSDPTATSPASVGSLLLAANGTLKVRAFKTNMLDSVVATAAYTILVQQAATPTFSIAPGTYAKTVTVAISSGTPGTTIRYTTNGNDPTTASALYSTAIALNGIVTLKARAYKNGMVDSNVAIRAYATTGDIYEPDDTPDKAKVITNGETQNRSLNVNTDTDWVKFVLPARSEVRIETNGTVGDTEMWLYGPDNSTIQIAYNDDYNKKFSCIYRLGNDALAPGTYYIKIQPYAHLAVVPAYTLSFHATTSQQTATPSYTPAPGTFSGPVTVAITSNTPGTYILYTIDGTDPVSSSRLYSVPIPLKATTVLKARAFKNGLAINNEAVGTYTILQTVATPALAPAPGTYLGR